MRSNSLFRSVLSLAVAAIVATFGLAVSAGGAMVATARRCWDYVTAWVSPPDCTPRKSPDQTRAVVELVTARSYLECLLRRVPPDVAFGCRLCASA